MSLKDEIENFIPEVEQHLRSFFEGHAAQIERGIKLAELVDADPLMQAAEAALGLPAGARASIADAIAKLDAEFTRVAQEATENGRQAGHAAALAELASPAEPAEGEQPAEPAAE